MYKQKFILILLGFIVYLCNAMTIGAEEKVITPEHILAEWKIKVYEYLMENQSAQEMFKGSHLSRGLLSL